MSAEEVICYPTPEEYLTRERKALRRSEYENGEIIAMAGASGEHNQITANLVRFLGNKLDGTPCTALSQDMRVALSYRKYYYPDVVVVCGKPEYRDDHVDTLLNPLIVFEVLSPSTESRDRKTKLRAYRDLETLQEIVYVSQEIPLVEIYRRDGDKWILNDFEGLDTMLILASLDCTLLLREIYSRIDFSQPLEVRKLRRTRTRTRKTP